MQPSDSKESQTSNMVDEKDVCNKKFLTLTCQLRDKKLINEERSNLIRLANTKISVTKIIELRCIAVSGKVYLDKFECFKEGYYNPLAKSSDKMT